MTKIDTQVFRLRKTNRTIELIGLPVAQVIKSYRPLPGSYTSTEPFPGYIAMGYVVDHTRPDSNEISLWIRNPVRLKWNNYPPEFIPHRAFNDEYKFAGDNGEEILMFRIQHVRIYTFESERDAQRAFVRIADNTGRVELVFPEDHGFYDK